MRELAQNLGDTHTIQALAYYLRGSQLNRSSPHSPHYWTPDTIAGLRGFALISALGGYAKGYSEGEPELRALIRRFRPNAAEDEIEVAVERIIAGVSERV